MSEIKTNKFYLKIKRIIDFLLAFIGIIILSPIFLILMIAIKLDSKGPILFKQRRIGINKSEFYILKFRTMRIDTPKDTPTHLLSNPEQYITKVGKFLRKTSLDELPQIINILKGEMSFIGPRPDLPDHYKLYSEGDKKKLSVRPGVTGYAQANGRNSNSWSQRIEMDIFYIENYSLLMDTQILFKTVFSVLKQEGVNKHSDSKDGAR